jgi:phage-related protein
MNNETRLIHYMGSSKKDLQKLPADVKEIFAQGLHNASLGDTPVGSKILKGFGGGSVLEIIEDYKSDTYRAVYTIKFKEAVYVLHVFKKKSTKGIKTPKKDQELIESRLKDAIAYNKQSSKKKEHKK